MVFTVAVIDVDGTVPEVVADVHTNDIGPKRMGVLTIGMLSNEMAMILVSEAPENEEKRNVYVCVPAAILAVI